jgi:beta-lactamase class C
MLTFLDAQLDQREVPADIRTAIVRTHEGQFRTAYFTQDMIWEQYEWPVDEKKLISGNAPDFILKPSANTGSCPPSAPAKAGSSEQAGIDERFRRICRLSPGQGSGCRRAGEPQLSQ